MKIRILFDSIKYITCIIIASCCLFIKNADADFDGTTFINGIPTTGNHDEDQAWGDIGSFYYNGLASAGGVNDYPPRAWTLSEGIRDSSQNEWALKKNDYGTIYGISACDSSSGSSGIQQYVMSGTAITKMENLSDISGGNCWCKLTGVAEVDGTEHDTSNTSWAFMVNLDEVVPNGCTTHCSYYCFMYAYYYPGWRSAILDGASFTMPGIKIATTKYVEDAFADSVTELNTAISTVKTVVDNTIIQADRIGKLYTGKQNRPDDSNINDRCPFGRDCLLITEADGTLHWYPICGADGSVEPLFDVSAFLAQLTSDGDSSYFHGNTTTYNALGKTGSAYTSQPSSDSIVRQLNETEWAVLWNNKGVVYGTSVCNDNSGTYAVASTTEQTETKGANCWCKMTGIARTDGIVYHVGSAWVFRDPAGVFDCANQCAGLCTVFPSALFDSITY